jgi:tRNA pseudouridine55 synthase
MTESSLPTLTRAVAASEAALDAWLAAAGDTGAVALIDKEEDWTSFDVVAKLRSMTRIRRIGHAGTLDPLATGVLIVCVGKATKRVDQFQEEDKVYRVTIKLGATTETDDRGSEERIVEGASQPPDQAILTALQAYVGTIQQTPPTYAAIKHAGRPQYDLARKGKAFIPRPRIVTINAITDVTIDWPFLHCTIECSKGTYIRSIARDIGNDLGVGGYVHALRRTKSGGFLAEDGVTISLLRDVFAARVVV